MYRVEHPYLAAPPVAFAHRGGSLDGRENSLAAFQRAVELGYTHLETDVQATADGALLAFHDPTLDRVTDARGLIARLPLAQVRRARIGGQEPIPLFDDLLDAFPTACFSVDCKSDAAVDPLIRLCTRRPEVLGRIAIGSFSSRRLARIRAALGPQLLTTATPREVRALLTASRRPGWVPGGARRSARVLHPTTGSIQVPVRAGVVGILTPRFLAAAHDLGAAVYAWTINDAAEMVRLLDLGVDGIISDDIDALREVLDSRRDGAIPPTTADDAAETGSTG